MGVFLAYLYIRNGQGIKEQEYNYDPEYIFEASPIMVPEHEGGLDKVLVKQKKRERPLPYEFYGENISSLSVLVGENGSGKTRSILFILNSIIRGEYEKGDEFIVIYKQGGVYCAVDHNLIVTYDFEESRCKEINMFDAFMWHSNVYDGYNSVVYEPVYRGGENKTIIYNSTLNSFINSKGEEPLGEIVHRTNSICEIMLNETIDLWESQNFKFMFQSHLTGFPNAIRVSIKASNNNEEENKLYEKHSSNFSSTYLVANEKYKEKYEVEVLEGFIKLDVERLYFDEAINMLALHYCRIINNKILEENFYEELKKGEQTGIDIMYELLRGKYKDLGVDYIDDIRCLSQLIPMYKIQKGGRRELILNLEKLLDENKEALSKWIESINEKFKDSITINFAYDEENSKQLGYSSGQLFRYRTWLELFKFRKKADKRSSILIAFDEWDLYLHPNLQRKGIQELVSLINKLFEGFTVQLILTSNTPYALSDTPSASVITLGSTENIGETFGANINNILKNQFFMEKTVGEFALKKINEVYVKLKDKSIEEYSYNANYEKIQIKRLIEVIGEPIVKNKLLQLYFEVYPEEEKKSYEVYEAQIRKLNAEIEKGVMIQREDAMKLQQILEESAKKLQRVLSNSEECDD